MADGTTTASLFGAAIGRAVMSAGLLLLAFAAYQLWGTGLAEARAQQELAADLALVLGTSEDLQSADSGWLDDQPAEDAAQPDDAALVVDDGTVTAAQPSPVRSAVPDPATAPSSPFSMPPAPLEVGEPFAALRIPSIGLDKTVVEGTTREALRSGPGHYLGTARPGRSGNVAIAGHRTTYGAPFRDIDQLTPGDPIVVETEDGTFTYRVEAQTGADGTRSGHRIVAPEQVGVIADHGDDRLTLTACHPLYSAKQRIVVTAVLDESWPLDGLGEVAAPVALAGPDSGPAAAATARPSPEAATAVTEPAPPSPIADRAAVRLVRATAIGPGDRSGELATDLEDDLGWQPVHAAATAAWAGLTALVAALAWTVGRLWRRVPAYLMAGPSFGLCLLTCFGHLDQLIPAA